MEKNSNNTVLSPLLKNGRNKAKSTKGISIDNLLKYVDAFILDK